MIVVTGVAAVVVSLEYVAQEHAEVKREAAEAVGVQAVYTQAGRVLPVGPVIVVATGPVGVMVDETLPEVTVVTVADG